MKTYKVNQIFYSIQGEGVRTGIPMIFLRFSRCNLKCKFCDTAHEKHDLMTAEEILEKCQTYPSKYISICGGEPTLQLDQYLIAILKTQGGYTLGIETNGTRPVPYGIDYIVVSPKVPAHTLEANFKDRPINEIKYLIADSDPLPDPPSSLNIANYLLSPIFDMDDPNQANINHAAALVMQNPKWALTYQAQKTWNIP